MPPAEYRRQLLGDDTVAYLRQLAEDAPALTEDQRTLIADAFRRKVSLS